MFPGVWRLYQFVALLKRSWVSKVIEAPVKCTSRAAASGAERQPWSATTRAAAASWLLTASGASSQRRKLQPPAATSAAARAAHASSQRHNLKRKIEPGLYGCSANPKWKTRVPGLFGMRHWVDPQHKEAFIRELEAIKVKKKFQGITSCSTANGTIVGEYKREVGRILEGARFRSPKVHCTKNDEYGNAVRQPRRVD